MTTDDMKKVLDAVSLCGDHIEAIPMFARLAAEFPEHHDAIEVAFNDKHGFDEFTFASVMAGRQHD